MELLMFLLGGAFGISVSSLCLLIEYIYKNGPTEDAVLDVLCECASIVFLFALISVLL